MKWLTCLSEKKTKVCLSEIYIVDAKSIYEACDKLSAMLTPEQRETLGTTTYADCLLITDGLEEREYSHIPWYYRYS
jgi:hypothetical protein